MLKLFCVIVGAKGSPFPVDIAVDETVGDLKKKMKQENLNTITCDAKDLELYLALKDGAWVGSKSSIVQAMKKGVVRETVRELVQEEMELDPADSIAACFVGTANYTKTLGRAQQSAG
jgi:hypothetical protein